MIDADRDPRHERHHCRRSPRIDNAQHFARWTQWFEQTPKGPHDTTRVVLFLNDTVINGHAPLDLPNQRAAARVIAAPSGTARTCHQYGVRGEAFLRLAQRTRGRTVRIMAPRLGDETYSISTFAGAEPMRFAPCASMQRRLDPWRSPISPL